MLLRAGADVDKSPANIVSGWQAMRNVNALASSLGNEPHYAMLRTDANFATIKAHINGVHAAGSWRAYILAQRLEVLTLRGLANCRRANGTVMSRGMIRSADPAMNNLVALPNELICHVLAFWFG